MSGRWVDLREAAELLGTSTEAVRKRAARGSLRSDRRDGRVLVWVDEGRTEGGREAQVDREALIEAKDQAIRILEEQLREEREARRRADTIIAQLTQANAALAARIPELEAPSGERSPDAPGGEAGAGLREESAPAQEAPPETREYAVAPSAEPGRGEPRPGGEEAQEGSEKMSWWRRVFGG
jgi:hypothetical protein